MRGGRGGGGGGVQIFKNYIYINTKETRTRVKNALSEDKKTGEHACAKGGLIRY